MGHTPLGSSPGPRLRSVTRYPQALLLMIWLLAHGSEEPWPGTGRGGGPDAGKGWVRHRGPVQTVAGLEGRGKGGAGDLWRDDRQTRRRRSGHHLRGVYSGGEDLCPRETYPAGGRPAARQAHSQRPESC